jgi:hypothetical protein
MRLLMRNNPNRKRMIALAVLLVGAAAMTVALMPDSTGRGFTQPGLLGVLRGALLTVGFMACGWGILTLLLLPPGGLSQSPSLQRGERPIARWTVDAETWRAFVELNAALDRQKAAVPNSAPRSDLPPTDVEIIVAPDGVCIGPDFYATPLLSAEDDFYWLPGPPQYFEFRTIIRGGSIHRFLLRFPIARGAEGQAELARVHFASLRQPPPQPETLRRWRNIALVVAGLSLAAFVGAHLITPLVAGRGALELLLNIMTVVGLVTFMTSLFLAVIWQRTLVGSHPR